MSAVTTFITRHTRHATPVIISAAIFVGGSYLKSYIESRDALDLVANPTEWQQTKPRLMALLSAFLAWGALNNQSIANRRKKLEGDNGATTPPLSEEEYFKRHAGPQPQGQPPVQPPKP